MLPLVPDPNDIVGSILSAFINIFLNPGEAAIKAALLMLLDNASGPDLSAAWIVRFYAIIWGIGIFISLVSSTMKALVASYSDDAYKFWSSWLIIVKSYVFGWILPVIFATGFVLSSAVVKAFTEQLSVDPSLADGLSALDAGNVLFNFVMMPFAIIFGTLLALVIWIVLIAMPILSFLIGPLLFSFSGGSKGSKAYSAFWALASTSFLSAPAMVLWLAGTGTALNELETSFPMTTTVRPFVNAAIILVAIWIPKMIFSWSHKNVSQVVAQGQLSIQGQAQASRQTQRSADPTSKRSAEKGKTHMVRNLIGFAAAGYAGYAASQALGDISGGSKAPSGNQGNQAQTTSRTSSILQMTGKMAQEDARRRAIDPKTGLGSTAAMSAASIALTRLASRQQQRTAKPPSVPNRPRKEG